MKEEITKEGLYFYEEHSMEENLLLVKSDASESTFEAEMLMHNPMSGLLPMRPVWRNGERYYAFSVDGYRTLEQKCTGTKLNGVTYEKIFTDIFTGVTTAKRHFLCEEGFWLSKESIFVKEDTWEVAICYVPSYRRSLREQMAELSEWLLPYLDVSDERAVYSGYSFHVLCHREQCNLRSLTEVLEKGAQLPFYSGKMSDETAEEQRECEELSVDTGCTEEEKGRGRREARNFLVGLLFAVSVACLLFFVIR